MLFQLLPEDRRKHCISKIIILPILLSLIYTIKRCPVAESLDSTAGHSVRSRSKDNTIMNRLLDNKGVKPKAKKPVDATSNNDPFPYLESVGTYSASNDLFPLGKCQGSCERNAHCQQGLQCRRLKPNEFYVPGCLGEIDGVGTRYCFDPNDSLVPQVPTQQGNAPSPSVSFSNAGSISEVSGSPSIMPTDSPTFPLIDSGALDQAPSVEPTANEQLTDVANDDSPGSFPLGLCEGDCDTDDDCADNLVCYLRDGISDVPGCYGFGSTNVDYCIDPTKLQIQANEIELKYEGDNSFPNSAYPLGRCEGDCDGDSECEGDLICFERNGFDKVPGCSGGGISNADYCIDPKDDPAKPPVPGSFRLKMFWRKGYTWQCEKQERNWCLECYETSCNVNDHVEVHTCSSKNTYFVFNNTKKVNGGEVTHIQVALTSLCLELIGDKNITLQECDFQSKNQQFSPGHGYSFNNTVFELHPKYSDGCLTQMHEPRLFETIFKRSCSLAEKWNTSLWHKY